MRTRVITAVLIGSAGAERTAEAGGGRRTAKGKVRAGRRPVEAGPPPLAPGLTAPAQELRAG